MISNRLKYIFENFSRYTRIICIEDYSFDYDKIVALSTQGYDIIIVGRGKNYEDYLTDKIPMIICFKSQWYKDHYNKLDCSKLTCPIYVWNKNDTINNE